MKLALLCCLVGTALAAHRELAVRGDTVEQDWMKTQQEQAENGKVNCVAGKYIAFTLSGFKACFACPAGTYQAAGNQVRCDKCPAGTYGTQSGQTSRGAACIDCVAPAYQKKEGATYCDSDDVECGDGKQLAAGTNECLECSPGRYSNRDTDFKCFDCPSNHFQEWAGQGSCKLCFPGKFNDRSRATYCMWRGKSDILPPRPADRHAIKECDAGSYRHKDANDKYACSYCPAGKYGTGNNACDTCGENTYQPYGGKTSQNDCLPCLNNKAGASKCDHSKAELTCPDGQESVVANEQDSATGWSQMLNHFKDACVGKDTLSETNECLAALGENRQCDEDEPGSFDDKCYTKKAQCHNCPEGTKKGAGDNYCVRCSAGRVATNNQMRAATALTYPTGGPTNAGFVEDKDEVHPQSWYEGSDQCSPCPRGTAWEHGKCRRCPEGYFSNIEGAVGCDKCPEGTWAGVGSETCEAVENGQFDKHCSGGRTWNPEGSPCTKSCDVREPVCDTQKVGRCECMSTSKPYWDDQLMRCVGDAECAALDPKCPYTQDLSCPDQESGFVYVMTKAKDPNDSRCLKYPCGVKKAATQCKWGHGNDGVHGQDWVGHNVVREQGWVGPGLGNDWCNRYTCSGGQFKLFPEGTTQQTCGDAPRCSHLRCKFVGGSVKVKYDKFESIGTSHHCGHLDENDPNNCMCKCFS